MPAAQGLASTGRWPAVLRSQTVVDREPCELRLAQRREERLDEARLVTAREASAVNENACGEWSGTIRREGIEREGNITCLRELDVFFQIRTRGGNKQQQQQRNDGLRTKDS